MYWGWTPPLCISIDCGSVVVSVVRRSFLGEGLKTTFICQHREKALDGREGVRWFSKSMVVDSPPVTILFTSTEQLAFQYQVWFP